MSFGDDLSDRFELDDEPEPVRVEIRGDIANLLRLLAARLGGQPLDGVASVAVVALAERMGVEVKTKVEPPRGQA
jgi:hypothetical protein